MTIGIITALPHEIKVLIEKINLVETSLKPYRIYRGEYNKFTIIALLSGPGKVSSGGAAQYLIDNNSPDFIVNLGVCGGLKSGVNIGDVIISNRYIQYDFNIGFTQNGKCWNPAYKSETVQTGIPEIVKPEDINGIMGTGDRFISSKEEKIFLRDKYEIIGCDMESGAIAQICYINSVDFISIKGVSDIGEGTGKNFKKDMMRGVESSTRELLKRLD